MDDTDSSRALTRGTMLFGEEHMRRRMEQWNALDPGFSKLIQEFIYGGMYDRDIIDQRTRELCAVAGLTVVGAGASELTLHIRAAEKMGATLDEVQEVILQMALYGGFPRAMKALDVFQKLGTRPAVRSEP